ncbi:hypothetical protein IWW50_004650, partial [Coemansia erecta]
RYREASFNLHDGARFYVSLESELQKIKDGCLDFAMARHLEALELLGTGETPVDLAQTPEQPDGGGQPNLVWDPTMPLKYTTTPKR